ncbi:unnamed protein product [Caenorhabditis auriculariae]|uniref:Uncharacterized protein n=1 Tax=Caenorhabditis auriculariae TaxID=2777116 RepID=A0A8S1HYP7_9PELO|nr:unnamed protein product [Caenorhabditis auriculariae]
MEKLPTTTRDSPKAALNCKTTGRRRADSISSEVLKLGDDALNHLPTLFQLSENHVEPGSIDGVEDHQHLEGRRPDRSEHDFTEVHCRKTGEETRKLPTDVPS